MSFTNGPTKAELMLGALQTWEKIRVSPKSTNDWFEDNVRSKFSERTSELLHEGMCWMGCGFPSISIGHKHAASLVATRLPKEYAQEIKMPWSAFWIDVPHGVIPAVSTSSASSVYKNTHVRGLLVVSRPDTSVFRIGMCDDSSWIHKAYASPADLACDDDIPSGGIDGLPVRMDTISRFVECVGRLVVGVAVEATEQLGSKIYQTTSPESIKKNRHGEPVTNTFTLTRDVKIDCRQAIREYVAGSGFSPTVQSLTRGHWRFQPHGPGREKRKWLFIEPYWRGPEDAPIAVRSHVIPDLTDVEIR